MALVLVTPPAVQPLSLETVRARLRIDDGVDDALLQLFIGAARGLIEGPRRIYELALITQTWDWMLDTWPTMPPYVLNFPLRPVQSITEIRYSSSAGVVILPPEGYQADLISDPARLFPPAGSTGWPVASTVPNAVTIRFVAGFGDAESDIEEDIRTSMLLAISRWKDLGDGLDLNGSTELTLPVQVQQLMHNYWRPYV